MDINFFIALAIGIIGYLITRVLLLVLTKISEVNPLIFLAGIYFIFFYLMDKMTHNIPELWKVKTYKNPYIIDGGIGTWFHLNTPKLSLYDVSLASFVIILTVHFLFTFLFKWNKKIDKP